MNNNILNQFNQKVAEDKQKECLIQFEKGLIDENTFGIRYEAADLLKGIQSPVGAVRFFGNHEMLKTEDGWQLIKGKKANVGENLDQVLNPQDDLEKGRKGLAIGTIKEYNGRKMIKTSNGWKFHGEGKSEKAQNHVKDALKHHTEKDEYPSWTTPSHLDKEDHAALKGIYDLYKKGKFKEALRDAQDCDTIVRDSIPPKIWKEIGGKLTTSGEEKLNSKKYGSDPELDKLVDDRDYKVRIAVAGQGYGLDKLVNDKDPDVRIAVANQGHGLEKLISDDDFDVRMAVAKHGYGLAKLVNDEDYRIRAEVAKHGYGLDKLINDKESDVRIAVAEQGYGLDKLVDDRHPIIRREVANQGYGLEKLVNDKDSRVRVAVANQGYGLEKLIGDDDFSVRAAVADQGYGLAKLVKDHHCVVREAVASQGYGLDKLVNDEDPNVRMMAKRVMLSKK